MTSDKNGNNLLMIVPTGHSISSSVNRRSVTPSGIAQNTFPPGALSNGTLIRPSIGSRPSTFPRSPQINPQAVIGSGILTNCSSSAPLTGNSTVNGNGPNCGQKRLKIEREDEEQNVQGKDCKSLTVSGHNVPVRKRVKVAFVKDSKGFCSDFRSSVDRK